MKDLRWMGLLVGAALCAGSLRAAEPAGNAEPAKGEPPKAEQGGGRGACKADIEKFCKDVKPGGGRVKKCLKEHQAELSEGCQKRGERLRERAGKGLEKAKEACQGDVEKLCKGVEPGEGRIAKCLKEHEAELSDGCKKVGERVQARRERMAKAHEACKGDAEKFCKGVEPGEGRIVKCLKEHEAELSEGCKKVGEEAREMREGKGPKAGKKGGKKADNKADQPPAEEKQK